MIITQVIRSTLVHGHTDMDREHCNQKLVVRSAGVSTSGSHFCLITHQQDIDANDHHLPTTSSDFPSCHGILLSEETYGSEQRYASRRDVEDAGYRFAEDEVTKFRVRMRSVLQPVQLSDDDAYHGKCKRRTQVT
jgi:hypothetical protein